MKIGRRGSIMRRSTPYESNSTRDRLLRRYAESVPNRLVEYNENNLLPGTLFLGEDSHVNRQNVVLQLKDMGYPIKTGELFPEEFLSFGEKVDKYEDLQGVFPDFLIEGMRVNDRALDKAKRSLPANASDALIKQLADTIKKADEQQYKSGNPVNESNVYRQVKEAEDDMLAYRIMTDPYYRAAAIGWVDKNGNHHDGYFSIMSKMVEDQQKRKAEQADRNYMKTTSAALGNEYAQYGVMIMNALSAVGDAIKSGQKLFTPPTDGNENPENNVWSLPEESYMRDVLPSFLQGRKEVRILNHQGKIIRGNEFSQMADNVKQALDLRDLIEDLDLRIQSAANSGDVKLEADLLKQRRELSKQIGELEINKDLLSSYESLPFIKLGEGYKNKEFFRPRDYTQMFQGFLDKFGVATDLGVHHYLSGYTKLLDELRTLERNGYKPGSENDIRAKYLRSQIRNILDTYKGAIAEKLKSWQQDAIDETADLEYLKEHLPVSDIFKANMELAQKDMKMSDPATLMFAMPQQLGSSNASLTLSLGSMAIKLAAAYSGNPYAIAAAIPVGSQMNIANAAWENNAEIAEGYRRRVEAALHKSHMYNDVLEEIKSKLSDGGKEIIITPNGPRVKEEDAEQLMRHLYNGEVTLDNIKANKIIGDAVFGADLTFQYDMGETARSAYKESMVQLLPVGPIVKGGKYVLNSGALALGKGIYNTLNIPRKLLGKSDLAVNIGNMNRYLASATAFAASMPKTILKGESYFSNTALFAARTLLNMLGEGIEEGVQHVHLDKFSKGIYNSSMNMGLFKPIAEDIILGGRLGLEWLTGIDHGSGYISDSQMFAEMRGGALGALFQSTPVTAVMQGSKLNSEIKAIDIAVDNAIREKLSQRDTIEKAKQFVKTMSNARYNDVMTMLDRFAKINEYQTEAAKARGTEDFGIAKEFIDETKKLYETAARYSNNKELNKLYKKNGIEKGSDLYNSMIAILTDQDTRLRDAGEEKKRSDSELAAKEGEVRSKAQQEIDLANAYNLISRDEDYGETQEAKVPIIDAEMLVKMARLKAALDVVNQYQQLEEQLKAENKPVYKSTIKKYAEQIIKKLNEELNTDIKTLDDFMEKFGVADEDLVKLNRENISINAEFDAAKNILSRLLTPNTAISTAKKLVSQYEAAIKNDEDLQQRIHDDYVSLLQRDEEILEMIKAFEEDEANQSVAPQTRTITLPDGQTKTVTVNDHTRAEEQRYIEDSLGAADQFGSIYDAVDNPEQTLFNIGSDVTAADYSEEDDQKNNPISKDQAEQLFGEFIDDVSSSTPWNRLRGGISRKAAGAVIKNLRGKLDRVGRSMALRISLLHNNGYKFREFAGKYYAVKRNARINLTRTEMMFGRFLSEKYGNDPILRNDVEYTPEDVESPESPAPVPVSPEPEPEKRKFEPSDEQKRIQEDLKAKAKKDEIQLVTRNGHDYIFNIDGKLVIYTRLHAEIGPQKEESDETIATKDKRIEELKTVWSDKDKLIEYVNKLQEDYNGALAKKYGDTSATYRKNKLDLSVYISKDLINNQQIIESIADLTKGFKENDDINVVSGAWATAGNIVDEMYRRVIDGDEISYTDILQIEGESIILSDVMEASLFDHLIEQIHDFKDWLDINHIVPVTDRVLLHTQLKNGHFVAGETDLIGIDRNGDLIIFDFKTSQFGFGDYYKTTLKGNKWSSERQHSRQLTGYNVMIQQEFQNKYNVSRMFIVAINVRYDKQDNVFVKFNSIEQLMGFELNIDSALFKLMDKPITKEEIEQHVKNLLKSVLEWGEKVDPYADKISDELKDKFNSFVARLYEFLNRIADILNSNIDKDSIMQEFLGFIDEFEDLRAEVDQQILMLIEAGIEGEKRSEVSTQELDKQAEILAEEMGLDENPMAEFDDDYLAHLVEEQTPKPVRKHGQRTLEEIAEDMNLHNKRQGKISGLLPGETPSGVLSGPAAPIKTQSTSIQNAPDYSKQNPVKFDAEIKERGQGYEEYNVADQRSVNGQLAEDCADPDFSENAHFIIDSKSLFSGKSTKDGIEGLDGDYIYAHINWKGKLYRIKFDWATSGKRGTRVREKIRSMYEAHPDAKIIVSKISRTNGKFKFGEVKNLLDSPFILDEKELLNILESGHLGISAVQEPIKGFTMPQINTLSKTSSAPIYPFKPGFSIVPGILTWVYTFQQSEKDAGDLNKVPIPLTPKRLTSTKNGDINLIVDILTHNIRMSAKEYHRTIKVNGKEVKSPLNDLQILNLLIYFGVQTRETNRGNNFIFDWVRDPSTGAVDNTRIEISGIGTDRGTIYTVDLTNKEDVDKLKDRLRVSGFVHVNNEAMLKYSLDGSVDNSESNPFKSMSNFFKHESNKDVDLVKISDSIIFDRKDFDFNEDGSFVALTGAGWVIRHGLVTTQFEKLYNARISIEDVDFADPMMDNAVEQGTKPQNNTVEKMDEPMSAEAIVGPQIDYDSQNDMFDMMNASSLEDGSIPDMPFKIVRSQATNTINPEQAMRRIRRMLGKNFKVNVIDGAVKVFEQGKAWAVGACKKDSIILSTLAEAGTEFHETFHRVMELLLSPSARRKLHQHYIKRYNAGVEISEIESGERLADMFMSFINNLPDVYLSWNILKTFRQIKDWVNAWRNLDDYKLAMMFMYTYSGLAKYNWVSKKSSENFDRIFGDAAYSTINVNGYDINFENFANGVHLRDGIKFATFLILRGYNIDSLGDNLADLDITYAAIKSKPWYNNAIGYGRENPSLLQKQMKEIFDHWGSTQKLVVDELERLSIVGKIDAKEKKNEDKQSGDLSAVSQDIDGHMDEFYKFDKKLDLDSSLKILLSTIPHMRYSTREDLKWETNEKGQFVDSKGKALKDQDDISKRVRRMADDGTGKMVPIGTVDNLVNKIKMSDGTVKITRTEVPISTNSLGTVEFMDFDTVYSLLISKLQDCYDVQDMIKRFIDLSNESPMYRYIGRKLFEWKYQSVARYQTGKEIAMIGDERLAQDDYNITYDEYGQMHIVYAHDSDNHKLGHVIENAYILTNPDKESLVTRMFQAFKSQRLSFVFVYANRIKDSRGNSTDYFSYENKPTNSTASTRIYPRQWFDNLRYGATPIFEVIGDAIRVRKGSEKLIGAIVKDFGYLMYQMFKSDSNIINLTHKGKDYQLNKQLPEDVDFIESWFIARLNMLGIDINKSVLDYYMSKQYYGMSKGDAFAELLSSRSKTSSFQSFLQMLGLLQDIVDSGEYSKLLVDTRPSKWRSIDASGMYMFSENAFVKELGTAYGSYNLATNEFMTLGPENTKMYTMAQNHTASEFTEDFNRAYVDSDGNVRGSRILDDMKKFCYNFFITEDGTMIGSQIIKHLHLIGRMPLRLETFIGVKKDDYHDGGTKYAKISKRDDFLSKVRILQNGGIIFPTLADKSTWFYLTGVRLKGFDYGTSTVDGVLPIFSSTTNRMAFGLDPVGSYRQNEVLDQLREYAECERASVVKAILELEALEDKESKERNPGKKLELQKKIKNFHTSNQATRFAFLTGVYSESAKSKKYKYKEKELFISFNFNKKLVDGKYVPAGLRDCLDVADQYYYSKTAEEQRSLLANILQHRLDEQLEWAVKAGIITDDGSKAVPYGQYRNKLLDNNVIENLKTRYKNYDIKGTKLGRISGFTDQVLESMAIVAYLNDINAKAIQSIEEVCRLYTGAPHFFKWTYGEDGVLADLRSDMAKRLGGLGSTGDSNRLDLPNIAREYTCAEIKDQFVQSEVYNAYKEGFIDNEYRIAVFDQEVSKIRNRLEKMSEEQRHQERKRIWKEIQEKSLDEIKKMADKRIRGIVEANAAAETKSFESGINVADGTAYITPEMCLNLLRQRGVYTGKVKEAFKHLMGMDAGSDMLSNHQAYKTIFDALISTQKYSAYGYRMENDTVVHFYNKFALFPLFKSMAFGFTHDMLNQMEKDGVDMLMFESAVKVGNEGGQEFNPDTFRRNNDDEDELNWNHDEDGNRTTLKPSLDNFKFNTYKQEYKFIRRQLNTDPREKELMSIGTQMLKIALANLFKEAIYKTSRGDIDGLELRNDIMNTLNKLSDIGKEKLKKELFTNDKIDIKKLSVFLKTELSKREADLNTLDGLEVIGEGENAKFVTPLEAMSNIEWIESIIISKINKEVIDVNLPGNAYYQRSVFGMEGSPIRVISDEAANKIENKNELSKMLAKARKMFMIYSGRTLKAINSDGSMDCFISVDYFVNQGIVPKELLGNYWAIRNYLKKNNIIGKNAKAIMVGYRIPTQAESSVHALRVVDVIPVVRDTIVLPKDFTKITGSDFDIDKLYLTSYNFNVTAEGVSPFTFEEGSVKYLQNRLLENYITLLKDGGSVDQDGNYTKGRTLQFLHRSIDNDTMLARGSKESVYERIVGNVVNKREEPFQYQSLSTQVDIKSQFIGGKFNIGPFALANNAQILTMLYDVEFRDNPIGIMHALDANSLHNRNDKNGNSILAWISAMINGAVDAAKDPWEAEININPYTYGIINMLLRTGMGDQTFMFINQPILREAADAFVLSDGVIIEDAGKTKTRRQEDAVQSRIHKYLDGPSKQNENWLKIVMSQGRFGDEREFLQISNDVIQIAQLLFGVENGLYTNEFYKWDASSNTKYSKPTKGKSILEDIISNPEVRLDPNAPMSMENISDVPYYALMLNGEWTEFSPKEIQMYVVGAMYQFRPYISALEDTVSYTKIDTKKHGKSWAEQMDYLENFEDLYVSDADGMFTKNINRMLEDSFIAHKTYNAINFLNDILQDRAVQYKQGFQIAIKNVQDRIQNHTQESRVHITRMLLGGIKNDFIQKYIEDNNIDWKSLFIGPNSIQRRLARIQMLVRSDLTGKYSEYASNGVVTNPLLAALESVPYARSAEQPMFIKLRRSMLDDSQMAKDIIYAWRDMLNDDNEEFKTFARDLIVYAMLTSNDTPGFTKFFKFVPKEWKEQSGYNDMMTRYKNMDDLALTSILEERIPTWIKQHWFDNILVPIQKYTDHKSSNGLKFFGYKIGTDNPILKGSNVLSIMGAIYQNNEYRYWQTSIKDDSAPEFIKIFRRNALSTDQDNVLVYQLVGHGTKILGKQSITYPIYKLIVPPGAYVNTSANSTFSIYTNETFSHPIEELVMHDEYSPESGNTMDFFNNTVSNMVTWMQNNPGKIIMDHPSIAKIANMFDKYYRDLAIESANNINLTITTLKVFTMTANADNSIELAKKEGEQIKDNCKQR